MFAMVRPLTAAHELTHELHTPLKPDNLLYTKHAAAPEPVLVEHDEQLDPPVPPWKLPAAQLVHDDDPTDDAYCPTAQLAQLDWPALGWLVPSAQLAHAVAPAAE